jgi:hypothetical protein
LRHMVGDENSWKKVWLAEFRSWTCPWLFLGDRMYLPKWTSRGLFRHLSDRTSCSQQQNTMEEKEFHTGNRVLWQRGRIDARSTFDWIWPHFTSILFSLKISFFRPGEIANAFCSCLSLESRVDG